MINLATTLLMLAVSHSVGSANIMPDITQDDGTLTLSVTQEHIPTQVHTPTPYNIVETGNGINISIARADKEHRMRDGEHHNGEHRNGEHHNGEHHNGEHRNGEHHNGEHRDGEHHNGEHAPGIHPRDKKGGDAPTTNGSDTNETNHILTLEENYNIDTPYTQADADAQYNAQKTALDLQYEHMFTLKSELDASKSENKVKRDEYRTLSKNYHEALNGIIAEWVTNLNS